MPGKWKDPRGPEPDVSPTAETDSSHRQRLNICVNSFVRVSDTAVGTKFKAASVRQVGFPRTLLNGLGDEGQICLTDKRPS